MQPRIRYRRLKQLEKGKGMSGFSWLESMGYSSSWLLSSENLWYGSDGMGDETGRSCMEGKESEDRSDVHGQ